MLPVFRDHDLHPRTPNQLVGLHSQQGEADGRNIHQLAIAVIDRDQIRGVLNDGAHQCAGLIQPAFEAAQPRHPLQNQRQFIPKTVGLLNKVGKAPAQSLDDHRFIADGSDKDDRKLRDARLRRVGHLPGFAVRKPIVQQQRHEFAGFIAAQSLQSGFDAGGNLDRITGTLERPPHQFSIPRVILHQAEPGGIVAASETGMLLMLREPPHPPNRHPAGG